MHSACDKKGDISTCLNWDGKEEEVNEVLVFQRIALNNGAILKKREKLYNLT